MLASLEHGELPKGSGRDHPPFEYEEIPEETDTRFGLMTDVVTEFQESQCYFIVATHTAAFVAIARGSLFKATSIGQASANCDFILVMAEVSTVMNYLGITMCSIVGMSSKWIRTLTVLSLLFSLIAMGLTSKRTEGRCFSNSRIEGIPPVPACGDHPPPNTYCGLLSPADTITRRDYFNEMFDFWTPFVLTGFCLICSIFLGILFHRHTKPNSIISYTKWPITKWFNFIGEHLQPNCVSSFTKPLKWLWANFISFIAVTHRSVKTRYRLYQFFCEFRHWLQVLLCVLCAVTLFMIYILSTLSRFGYVDFKDWGIGQIIAVFVWVPVVAHWIRWETK